MKFPVNLQTFSNWFVTALPAEVPPRLNARRYPHGRMASLARWDLVSEDIRSLKSRTEPIGRALTHGKKIQLLYAANSKPEWRTARLAITLALCTTMRRVELRNLKWRHVDLLNRCIKSGVAKQKQGAETYR